MVAAIRLGQLDAGRRIEVETRGGGLGIEWPGGENGRVFMSGPAETVFEGSLAL